MMQRRKLLLSLVCNVCKARLPIAYGNNSYDVTPEIASLRFTCLGWFTQGNVSKCPTCSGLPVLTAKAVLADVWNFLKLTGRTRILHPKDVPADWSGSSIFGRKRAK
jgi:hypothetical protein